MGVVAFLKWALSLAMFAAMLGLCLYRLDAAGIAGLAGAGLGFGWGYIAPGQSTTGERLGNGYFSALMGLCVGFALGAVGHLAWPYIEILRAQV